MQLALLLGSYLAFAHQGAYNVTRSEWDAFKLEHGKVYESENVETLRKAIFGFNREMVADFSRNNVEAQDFEIELNHLADMGEFDMKSINGFRASEKSLQSNKLRNSPEGQKFIDDILNDDSIEVPDAIDWRTVPGRVTRVKNQGQCGSCWAFASTGALEGQEAVRQKFRGASANSSTVELSEQNLVDCVTDDMGCNGGIMEDAFNFVKKEGGIDDEASYPYEANDGKCRFQKSHVAMTDKGSAILPQGDEEKLKAMVAKFGPVAVAIDAGSLWFQLYKKGVYYNKHCHNKPNQLDHGVLVVGYGTDPKKGDFWIVKNSWGPKWGENGYIRMARNKKNHCGIATEATVPTF